jgi:transcriptional regulator with XRE-family HTH domain
VEDDIQQQLAVQPALRAEMGRLDPYQQIAAQVILYRTRNHLTQAELARRVGTSATAIARLESGLHHPSVETLHRVAHALNLRLTITLEEQPAGEPIAV